VYVNVIDGLAALRPRIHDETEAVVASETPSDIGCHFDQLGEELAVLRIDETADVRVMMDRHYQYVRRCLRIDILDRDDVAIALHHFRGNLSRRNLTENAIVRHINVP
jgi:hypothetical protein